MSDLFTLLQQRQQGQDVPPAMQQQYNQWRQQQLAHWTQTFAPLVGGQQSLQAGGSNPAAVKQQRVIQYYSTDSPQLRQEFMQTLQGGQ